MNPANQAILDECRRHYDFYKRTETLQSSGMHAVTFHQLKELERIVHEEFVPGYRADLSGCGPCIGAHLTYVYRKYDDWLAQQPVKVAATFPVNDRPIKEVVISSEVYEDANGNTVWEVKTKKAETPEETKTRLSDPNRIIKRRAKRK